MISSSGSPKMIIANRQSDSTFEEIPVIDFADASSSNPVRRMALAEKIRDACVNVGFFYITNHGIPEDIVTDAVEAGKKFFALPISSKMDLDIHKAKNFKGYTALLGENTDPAGRGDLHEGFDIGWEGHQPPRSIGQDILSRNDGGMSGTNIWPDLPGFKDPVLSYYHSVVEFGLKLFPLFALALDLPENFFEDKTTKPAAIMRLLHYPPQSPSTLDNDGNEIGIGAHTDYECFTILWQDTISALQVQNTEGKWIDAVPIPGTFVLNIGDQLARWTNDVFKSTVHRAINKSGQERYSVPLFFGVDYDVLLKPIPSCISSEMPAKYEVVTAGEYVKRRLQETYTHSAKQ
ncbi:Clavaminate synthase-like protein [Lentinula aciculospora]|uniref:Clavaminate synthase-like protein n=1 Tax=Lentinula aciculospora TaxID=153920 RepID=A0A9W9AIE1_9AGAR|nr:Clavaminate synthase-like protein [Lentinula aciculospora]